MLSIGAWGTATKHTHRLSRSWTWDAAGTWKTKQFPISFWLHKQRQWSLQINSNALQGRHTACKTLAKEILANLRHNKTHVAPRISKHMDFRSTAYTKHHKLCTSQFLSIPPFPWDKGLSRHPRKIRVQLSFSPLSPPKPKLSGNTALLEGFLQLHLALRTSNQLFSSPVKKIKSQNIPANCNFWNRQRQEEIRAKLSHFHVSCYIHSKSSTMTHTPAQTLLQCVKKVPRTQLCLHLWALMSPDQGYSLRTASFKLKKSFLNSVTVQHLLWINTVELLGFLCWRLYQFRQVEFKIALYSKQTL